MPSVVPGFEYDLFVSYRHNDNLDGWVTNFVHDLQRELKTTIKDSVHVYFDNNPFDGLLETHSVDKSLSGKLKCLIFIPVVSQTYCDTKSFAWQHEFCAFAGQAKEDAIGADIRLSNGNVSSRILPVRIHDLDSDDHSLFERVTGGPLRSVDFIYKEPGVNRPLKPGDLRSDNQNKTDYRNQLNKIANAVKDILHGIAKPAAANSSPVVAIKVQQDVDRPSLAVLPFSNLSNDPEQEFFSDGITENIISELATNKSLRIISRTSVMRYKKTTKSVAEIAEELNVQFMLEGGVQMSGKKVRINAQLVEAHNEKLTWSKVFVEDRDDIFAVQSLVASVVAKELNASIIPQEAKSTAPNAEAYSLFLKGRHAFNQWNVEGYKLASEYFKKAISIDSEFREGYSFLASSYSARMSWNGDLSPGEALPYIEKFLAEAWKRGPSANDYLTKAFVEFFVRKNFIAAEEYLLKAMDLSPNDASVMYAYCYLLNMMGRFTEASRFVEVARQIDPLTVAWFNYQTMCKYLQGDFPAALQTLDEAMQLYPAVTRFFDFRARVLLAMSRWADAEKSALDGLRFSRPPSIVAFLSVAQHKQGKVQDCQQSLSELVERAGKGEKGVHIYIVYACSLTGELGAAMSWYQKARTTNDVDLIWKDVDPLLTGMRSHLGANTGIANGHPDFEAAGLSVLSMLESRMPALSYHNLEHIRDVVAAAQRIAIHQNRTPEEMKMLNLAAFLHDAGFIQSAKDHEEHGVKIARELLPQFGFDQEQVKAIEGMILATRLPQSPKTDLEAILCDADLDYLGRDDFYDLGNRLYIEMKDAGAVETEREWNIMQRTFLQSHMYHTKYSQLNREGAKQARITEISEKLKQGNSK